MTSGALWGLTGTDLTTILSTALADLQRDGYGVVVFIGSDCPELPNDAIIRGIVEASTSRGETERKSAMICPADDGGYVMLGVSKPKTHLNHIHT